MISSFRMNIKERSARMEKYAKVIVKNNSQYTDNLFTYKVPEFLQDEICLGHRVLVPFGKGNKPIEAYVFLSFIPYSSLSSATAVEYAIFLSTSLSSFIFPFLSNTLWSTNLLFSLSFSLKSYIS